MAVKDDVKAFWDEAALLVEDEKVVRFRSKDEIESARAAIEKGKSEQDPLLELSQDPETGLWWFRCR